MKDEKMFMWFATGSYGDVAWNGPHFITDIKKIGKKPCHSLEDLLKLDISDKIKKKLQNAKPGARITFSSLCANGELMLKCLSAEKIKELNKLKILQKKSSKANKKAQELELECTLQLKKLSKF